MTSSTNYSSFASFPIDLNEDQYDHQVQLPFSPNLPTETALSSSSLSYPVIFNPPQVQGGFYCGGDSKALQNHEEAKIYVWHGGSCENPTLKIENDSGIKLSACKKEERNENQSKSKKYSTSVKWMSSKMRIMRKMMSPDQAVGDSSENSIQKLEDQNGRVSSSPSQTIHNSNNNSSTNCNNSIRVCSDCNTTKTPLWRSGPRGPKSLCNACGIRQRKARRAMAAAAAAAEGTTNGTILGADRPVIKSKVQHKEKKANNNHLPFKKRCKFTNQARGRKKFGFDDLAMILSKNSTSQRVFPQDEKEAAILLMALSYGLVHG